MNIKLLSLIVAAGMLSIFATNKVHTDGSYTIDTKASQVHWLGKKVTGEHKGTVPISKGSLTVGEGIITGGEFDIDIAKLVCTDLEGDMKGNLEGHLHSPDFFNSKEFPTAKLKITKSERQEGNEVLVSGTLTIKGITKDVSFPARVTIQNHAIRANADFQINRTRWDIKYGSGSFFDNLGDKTIEDNIYFTVNLIGTQNGH